MSENGIPVWGEGDVPEVMTEREIAKAIGGEIERAPGLFSTEQVKGIRSWNDAAALFEEINVPVDLADEILGDGFALLDNKEFLVGAPVIFLDWTFHSGNMGEFVSVRAIKKIGEMPEDIKLVRFSDGSTGIFQQLKAYTDKKGVAGGLVSRRGLRASHYEVENPNKPGTFMDATTYYIDTSAAV